MHLRGSVYTAVLYSTPNTITGLASGGRVSIALLDTPGVATEVRFN